MLSIKKIIIIKDWNKLNLTSEAVSFDSTSTTEGIQFKSNHEGY